MTINTITAYAKALSKDGEPFYASEFHLDGGTMSALQNHGLIEKTGNQKEVMVQIYDDFYKKCKINEWKTTYKEYRIDQYLRGQIVREYQKAKDMVSACDKLIAKGII